MPGLKTPISALFPRVNVPGCTKMFKTEHLSKYFRISPVCPTKNLSTRLGPRLPKLLFMAWALRYASGSAEALYQDGSWRE